MGLGGKVCVRLRVRSTHYLYKFTFPQKRYDVHGIYCLKRRQRRSPRSIETQTQTCSSSHLLMNFLLCQPPHPNRYVVKIVQFKSWAWFRRDYDKLLKIEKIENKQCKFLFFLIFYRFHFQIGFDLNQADWKWQLFKFQAQNFWRKLNNHSNDR